MEPKNTLCIFLSLSSVLGSATTPLSPQTERTDPPPAVAVRPYVPDHPSRPQSPRKGPATMNSSSIYSMYLQQPQSKNYGSLSNRTTVKAGIKYIFIDSAVCRHTVFFIVVAVSTIYNLPNYYLSHSLFFHSLW